MAHGYKLVGIASRFSVDYIPSLIGINADQDKPASTDRYYERFDLDLASGQVHTIVWTDTVSYDSLPGERDPLLIIEGHKNVAFYIPASEMIEIAQEIGDTTLLERLAAKRNFRLDVAERRGALL